LIRYLQNFNFDLNEINVSYFCKLFDLLWSVVMKLTDHFNSKVKKIILMILVSCFVWCGMKRTKKYYIDTDKYFYLKQHNSSIPLESSFICFSFLSYYISYSWFTSKWFDYTYMKKIQIIPFSLSLRRTFLTKHHS